MIVGIDATTLKGRLSGVGYYTARLIDSLANGAGEDVLERIVVLSNQRVPLPEAARLRLHARDRFRIRSVWMQLLLPRILRELRPDLVHFTNYLAPATCETPYVLSIHDMSLQLFPECHTWKKRVLTSRLLPRVARRARLILAPSESTRRDVVRLLGLDPARVRVIPYAASAGFRPVAPDYARLERLYGVRPPYFLYVGTLEPRKNLERALRAFARALPSLPGASFVLVGQRGWKYAATLREAAMAEGLRALANDAALRQELAARGRQRAALYSWDRTGRETVAAYREVLEQRAPAAFPPPTRDPDEAILRTLLYASLFEAPLSREALQRSLMDVPLDRGALEQRLAGARLRAHVAASDGVLYPPGREAWLTKRTERRAHTQSLLERYRIPLQALQRFPYVRLVALSGACAHDNACDDDVDVFLVVREGRAWGVSLALMLLSKLLGLRRALCLNYTLDEAALQLPERDLFTAAELVGMRPLAGRATYLRLVGSNLWLASRFPNFAASYDAWCAGVPEAPGSRLLERLLDLGPAPLFERLSRSVLGAYLRWRTRGHPGVRLEPHRLKLHTEDHGPRLIAAFEQALSATQPRDGA